MVDLFAKDKRAIGIYCNQCRSYLDHVSWEDGANNSPKDGLYQVDEFIRTNPVENKVFQRLVNVFLTSQSLRQLKEKCVSEANTASLIIESGKPSESLVKNLAQAEVLQRQSSLFGLIDELFAMNTDKGTHWALQLTTHLFNPEEYIEHWLSRKQYDEISPSHLNKIYLRIIPFLKSEYYLLSYGESNANPDSNYLLTSIESIEGEVASFYLSSQESFSVSDPDGRSSIWHTKQHRYYHPSTGEMLAFTWESLIKEGHIVRKRISYIGVLTGDAYTVIRSAHSGKDVINVPLGDRKITIDFEIITSELIRSKHLKGDEHISYDVMNISPTGIEIHREESTVIAGEDEYVNILSGRADKDLESRSLMKYDFDGRLIGFSSGGLTACIEGACSLFEQRKLRKKIVPTISDDHHMTLANYVGEMALTVNGIEKPFVENSRYEWQRIGNDRWRLKSKVANVQADSPDSVQYLKKTSEIQLKNAMIRSIAQQVAGDQKNDIGKVTKLAQWINDKIDVKYDMTESSSLQVLKDKRGDCTEVTRLFVSMSMALNIPAREVTGLPYSHRDRAFVGHRWAEVQIDGNWIAVDPSSGEFPADAKHILIFRGDEYSQEKMADVSRDVKIHANSIVRSSQQ